MTTDRNRFDIIVIGAGIAGAGIAAELAGRASVALVEMEPRPGYHTTGRSAALFAPIYGPAPIRALTRASEAFYLDPPEGFAEAPLLTPRGVLMVARADQMGVFEPAFETLSAEGPLERMDGAGARAMFPPLREGYCEAAYFDEGCMDIDVHALHQGYLARFAAAGGRLLTKTEVTGLSRADGVWTATARGAELEAPLEAPLVVNAAGAWADVVGRLAGAGEIGLVPKRRTALIVEAPEGVDLGSAPALIDIDERFYAKPEAGKLLISPANEDPEAPSDVQPDELDIAICVDRIERALDISVRRIDSRWAGLRSFVADKCPVVGFSAQAGGFFWLAGQGGYGIQSAPALSRLAAAHLLGEPTPQDILDEGLDPAALAPARLGA